MLNEAKHFLFLTELLGKKVYQSLDATGEIPSSEKIRFRRIGKVVEVIASPKKTYPEVTKLVISPGMFKEKVMVNWEKILPFELPITKLILKEDTVLQSFQLNENEIALKEAVLDKQVVDMHGCKVVRVNDIHLLKEQHKLLVVHIDISFRALIRRLGWEKSLDKILNWIFTYKLPEEFISWKNIQQVPPTVDHLGTFSFQVKNLSQKMSDIHPVDLAEIMMDLSRYERLELFKSLDSKTAAEVLAELKLDIQRRLLETLPREKRYEIVSLMAPDKAADLLTHLSPKRREEIMKHLPVDKANLIKGLIIHPAETAGSLMTSQFIALSPHLTVEEAITKIKEKASQITAIYYIYIVDESQTLLGVVTLRRLLVAQPGTKLIEIMKSPLIKVKVNTSEHRVVRLFVKYNFGAIPVVDAHNKLLGIIMFKDAVDKVLSTAREK